MKKGFFSKKAMTSVEIIMFVVLAIIVITFVLYKIIGAGSSAKILP